MAMRVCCFARTRRGCEPIRFWVFGQGAVEALDGKKSVASGRRVWFCGLCFCETVSLQYVVGEGVPEHDGTDLLDAAYRQLPEVPVAPTRMDAFADRTGLVLCLAGFTGHASTPGRYSGAVLASG